MGNEEREKSRTREMKNTRGKGCEVYRRKDGELGFRGSRRGQS